MMDTIQKQLYRSFELYDDRAAIVCDDMIISYTQLAGMSQPGNAAWPVLKKGSRVAVCLENRIDIILSAIFIFRSGCIFIPVENTLPESRVKQLVISSGCDTLIINDAVYRANAGFFDNLGREVKLHFFNRDQSSRQCNADPGGDIYAGDEDDDLYVYFTSGSTGIPKAVLGRNGSLAAFVKWEIGEFDITPGTRFSQLINPGFDAWLRDVFVPLCAGGTCVIPGSSHEIADPERLTNWLEKNMVNAVHCVPSFFSLIINRSIGNNSYPELRYVFLSGEKPVTGDLERWYQRIGDRVNLINFYGPTETTMIRFFYRIQPADIKRPFIPAGKPVTGAKLFLLDKQMKPVGTKMAGDIYIGGEGLTKGYLDDPALTGKSFIKDFPSAGETVYQTGDIGMLLEDGNLVLKGRSDRQLKLMGVRINPEEIENVLAQYRGVQRCIVIPSKDEPRPLLVAYIATGDSLIKDELKQFASEKLPAALCPAHYVLVEQFPLKSNGKIDYSRLPSVQTVKQLTRPAEEAQLRLAEIWSRLLQIDISVIYLESDFFELGGHSLNSVVLSAKIEAAWKVHFPVSVIFANPTLGGMTGQIAAAPVKENVVLTPAPEKQHYPLSQMQDRIYFLQKLDPDSTAYNISSVFEVRGHLDVRRMDEVINTIAERHGALRSYFPLVDGLPVQKISAGQKLAVQVINAEAGNWEVTVKRFIQPFDLSQPLLFRAAVINRGDMAPLFVFDVHHSICDGTSLGILVKEALQLYNDVPLPGVPWQYIDYVEQMAADSETGKYADDKDYWLQRLSGHVPVLQLPYDFERPARLSLTGESFHFSLDPGTVSDLKRIARQENVSFYTVLLTGYAVLLHKLSGQNEMVIGSVASGRTQAAFQETVGMFANTIALRLQTMPGSSFASVLASIASVVTEALERQSFSFEELVKETVKTRDASRSPLFDVMFNLQNLDIPAIETANTSFRRLDIEKGISKFDLTLRGIEEASQFEFTFEYNSSLFTLQTIQRFASYLANIYESFVSDPSLSIGQIDILSPEEHQIESGYENGETIPERFERPVDLFYNNMGTYGSCIAVEAEGRSYTYNEIDRLSDLVSANLTDMGIQPDHSIALLIDHSAELLIMILGIMKSGAAFLPVDKSLPFKRKLSMISACDTPLIVTDESSTAFPGIAGIQMLTPGELMNGVLAAQTSRPGTSGANLAYTIFTSGTTGAAKGVQISNSALLNYVQSCIPRYCRDEKDCFAFFTPLSFDLTLTSLFVPLLSGRKIKIYKPSGNEARTMQEIVGRGDVSVLKLTPSHLRIVNELKEFSPRIHTLVVGGEMLPYQLAFSVYRKFRGRVSIINEYGPTEATIGCMFHRFNPGEVYESVPIGLPLPNNSIYLFNALGARVPVGVTGEIYIGGMQLSTGYRNASAEAAAKFITGGDGRRYYRTGDLARRLPDGNLLYLGREDEQLKIRGYRIEPAEIENQLQQFEAISAAIVSSKIMADGEPALVAYYVAPAMYGVTELKAFLAGSLPAYMIPSYFVRLERLPLTLNGKTDRDLLPPPSVVTEASLITDSPDKESADQLAGILKKIWSRILSVDDALINDEADFFLLGGHSLTVINLISRIQKETGVLVSIGDLFDASLFAAQVKLVADTMAQQTREDATPIVPSLPKAATASSYPLSSVQRRLFFLYQFTPGSLSYNVPVVLRIDGKIDVTRVGTAFRTLIAKHENFRTVFREQFGVPRQFIVNESAFELEVFHETDIDKVMHDFVRPFQLEQAPPFRAGIVHTGTDTNYLLLDMHHIISDEIMLQRLMSGFADIYFGKEAGTPRFQYKDFAVWQQEDAGFLEQTAAQKQYWLKLLQGEVPALLLPADHPRPSLKSYQGDIISRRISRDQLGKLKTAARSNSVTDYVFLLSVYHILVSRLCGSEDVITGTITSGRRREELQEIMGVFVNTVILRTNAAAELPFSTYLLQVKKQVAEAFENEDYPFEDILDNLNLPRDLSCNPLFEIMFNMHPVGLHTVETGGLKITPVFNNSHTTKFDLNLQVMEDGDELQLQFYYSTVLFNPLTVERWADHYLQLLMAAADAPATPVGQLDWLHPQEKNRLIYSLNNTSAPYEREKLIHELFEKQAKENPRMVAVLDNQEAFSYKELNRMANSLAAALTEDGVREGKYVAITMDRSVHTIVAVLGVLKAGGAYVPLEPYLPSQRIEGIFRSLTITHVLTDRNCAQKILDIGRNLHQELTMYVLDAALNTEDVVIPEALHILQPSDIFNRKSDVNRKAPVTAASLAYVIFTSGSTGIPKGVSVQHRPVINLIEWVNRRYQIGKETRMLFTTSLAFDLSVYDIFGMLAAGGSIRVATREELREPVQLKEIIRQERITFWDSAPAALQQVLPYLAELKGQPLLPDLFFLSGDWIPLTMPPQIRDVFPSARVVGLGGATEATVWSNFFDIGQIDPTWKSIPYGTPIQNARYYILDRHLNVCPVGIKGDLYIGGECLASGYLNDEELTATKFIPDPFFKGDTMYRTGDKARWFEDGNIEFLGREDAQVKIRGYRVELGEIESHLKKYDQISTVRAIAKKDAGGQQVICAYYIADVTYSEPALRAHLISFLPEYMIPSYFFRVSSFPVTANGKLDTAKLPDPVSGGAVDETQSEQLTDLQQSIRNIWAEVLHTPAGKIALLADFFRSGGNSLTATQLLAQVLKIFSINVPLVYFFQKPTIKAIADFITGNKQVEWTKMSPAPVQPFYRLSPAQQRMFSLQYLTPEMTAYNIVAAFSVYRKPDLEKITEALRKVINRHESLRTCFHVNDGRPVQQIIDTVMLDVEQYEIPESSLDACLKAFKRPFDLGIPPLFRVAVVHTGSDRFVLTLDIHHIIADGVSMSVLVNDFNRFYAGQEPDGPPIQYRDYLNWYFADDLIDISRQKQFWLDMFREPVKPMELTDQARRSDAFSYQGAGELLSIKEDVHTQISSLETQEGVTLYMVLLAAVNVFFARISGREDIVIGTPVAGRKHPDLASIVGVFVNVLALRNQPSKNKTFRSFLREVKDMVIHSFDHQDYQFDDLVKEVLPERDFSRNPLFDVYFFMDNIGIPLLQLDDAIITLIAEERLSTQYDIMIGASVQDGQLVLSFNYRTDLFDRERILLWCHHFRVLLDILVMEPDRSIGDIPVDLPLPASIPSLDTVS